MLVALAFDGLVTEQKLQGLENRIQICRTAPNERTVAPSTTGVRQHGQQNGFASSQNSESQTRPEPCSRRARQCAET